MFDLKSYLEIRAEQLRKTVEDCKESLKKAPAGKLWAESREKGYTYYYSEKSERGKKGKYLHKDQFELAKKLAQRDYNKLVLYSAEEELKKIEHLITYFPKVSAEDIYNQLGMARKVLVDPFYLPDDEFIENWEAEGFLTLDAYDWTNEIFTARGERVRSKSEKIIADMLAAKKIPYKYEAQLYLENFGDVYPDFTCLNVSERREVYIEHLGLMDDFEYAARNIKKIAAYESEGYYLGESLLITYETASMPLNTKLLERQIDRFFGLK